MSEKPVQPAEYTIERPELWTLLLAVGDDRLEYILFSRAQDNSLRSGQVLLDLNGGDYLHAVENAVYDHPVLLDDYGEVRIVAHSPHFLLLPAGTAADEEVANQLLAGAYPDDDGDLCTCSLPQNELDIAFTLPRGVLGFLQRTFNMAPVLHHLFPLCEHFCRLNMNSGIKRMFLNLHERYMDLVIYDCGHLHMANTFPFRNEEDAAFLALHAWQECQLNPKHDELQLTGTKAMRDKVAPKFRKYINYVMPAIFPASALAIGQDAMKAPLDLILLATCE